MATSYPNTSNANAVSDGPDFTEKCKYLAERSKNKLTTAFKLELDLQKQLEEAEFAVQRAKNNIEENKAVIALEVGKLAQIEMSNKMQSTLTCSICLLIMKDPVVSSYNGACTHSFCRNCITTWTNQQQHGGETCPKCRLNIGRRFVTIQALKEIIDQLNDVDTLYNVVTKHENNKRKRKTKRSAFLKQRRRFTWISDSDDDTSSSPLPDVIGMVQPTGDATNSSDAENTLSQFI